MHQDTPLLTTLALALGLAYLLGLLANRLRMPPLIGYLCTGIVIGPFTPGPLANQALATELAEIGVILLMFGVGLHFSVKDLLSVKRIAIPGAILQIIGATLLGWLLGTLLGWPLGQSLVFGLALSVASTVVLLKTLQKYGLEQTEQGRIAIGWLIVEDLVMVLTLVLLPALAGLLGGQTNDAQQNLGALLLLTSGKVIAFIAFMLIIGRRVIPWVLEKTVWTGSRELFRLGVLSIALGVAYGASHLFGVSFALGAFFAGMVLAESEFSHRAAEESLPLRDAFAVLFFVSVGMLFNPQIIVDQPLALLGTVLVIMVGKTLAAWGIVRLYGYANGVAAMIAASLAQIGEFSFILATLGLSLGLINADANALIIAGALISILLNPPLFSVLTRTIPGTGNQPESNQ
ncbi:cation:proton antiporter [Chitinibacter sp. S2-10]|uniref:cation:proton antiporter domain-containing protein n=1 Tax=Chitinibacter sp. S2-10 TaxID=3373597 RepID=UPI003977B62C